MSTVSREGWKAKVLMIETVTCTVYFTVLERKNWGKGRDPLPLPFRVFFEHAICSRKRHVETFQREEEMGELKGAERGGEGGERRENACPKTLWNEKHPLIRRTWLFFRKWVADNNKTTKQSLQSKDSHCLKKNKLEFIIGFILTESQCNSPQLMKLEFKPQFIILNSSL